MQNSATVVTIWVLQKHFRKSTGPAHFITLTGKVSLMQRDFLANYMNKRIKEWKCMSHVQKLSDQKLQVYKAGRTQTASQAKTINTDSITC